MRILFLSHTSRRSVFRVGSHHLAREFAGRGHRVVHLSNPLSVAHLARLSDDEVRRRARMAVPLRLHPIDGALFGVPWSVFPLTPDPLGRPLTLGSTRLLRNALRRADCLDPDLVLVDQPLLSHLIEPLGARAVVYRPTDLHTGGQALEAQRRLLQRADGVIATSQTVLDPLLAQGFGGPTAVVPNGVDLELFGSADAAAAGTARRGAVYVGALDGRFDWDAVAAVARAAPNEPVDVHGPGPGSRPALPPNVVVHGPVDYARVPGILAAHRVGLLPLNDDPTNEGRSPMKLFEYLAAGLAVVARATPALTAHRLTDVHTYRSAGDAGDAFRAAVAAPPSPAGRAAAATMSWGSRAELVLDAATAMAAGRPVAVPG
ncbi:glycosyltransferase [Nakamurella deserti]|uniref:glycosyltransferase n=1 Tax=Nakamurella deserti TaxID=2164074 RepID=UPI000DBE9CF2|nr:glycosyltransferase [Nakamurella deserti]